MSDTASSQSVVPNVDTTTPAPTAPTTSDTPTTTSATTDATTPAPATTTPVDALPTTTTTTTTTEPTVLAKKEEDPPAKPTEEKVKKQKKRQVIDFDAQEQDEDFLKKPTKKTKKIPSFEDKDDNDQNLVQLGSALDILKAEGVDVSFLPDKHRDEKKKQLEQQAAEEWEKMQQKIREEPLTITFSYYNGTGHRFEVTIKKGDSVLQFLAAAHKVITAAGHSDIRRLPPEAMIYVKEDLILPHHYTFYDFFLTNARGKSGSLVNFGVQDDVRLKGDARLEKNDAHAGKVMSRDYYNKHKHIFPLTRFEQYDPKKTYDKYTIA